MLDGLLGRNGFTSKSKSLIKPTRTRIAALRRREEAKHRFLKEDLAKLLANGLDVNAYGRTEEFIAGLNLLSCYTFIDQSCEYILKQLSVMQKLGQCPEECRETVASLMFAAARFSDLPELRDLRDLFQERYGNGFECYVNQVFVEKLASKPPVMEKRIKLLQDIAAELLIQWDSKGFKQRMDKSSALGPKLGSLIATDDECKPPIGNNGFRKNDQHVKERVEHAHQVPLLRNDKIVNIRRKEVLDIPNVEKKKHGYKHDKLAAKAENGGYSSKGTPESNINKNIFGENGKMPEVFDDDRVIRGRHERHGYKHELVATKTRDNDVLDGLIFGREGKHHKERRSGTEDVISSKSTGKVEEDVIRGRNERHGYKHELVATKTRDNDVLDGPIFRREEKHHKERRSVTEDVISSKSTGKVKEEDVTRSKSTYNSSLPPPYVKLNIPPPYSKPHNASNMEKMKKESDHEIEDLHYQNNMIPLPKPKSVRRRHRHSKSSSSHDDIGSSEDAHIVKRVSSSRRKERKGLQILFDDEQYPSHRDEEEKMMDKLLLHYSKKPSVYDVGKLRKKKTRSNSNDEEIIVPPTRSISLPHEESGESEPKKVYVRANSFQPDNQAKHVHPKLPDYDDLAARFAAMRGR